jgi:hypothetical protein
MVTRKQYSYWTIEHGLQDATSIVLKVMLAVLCWSDQVAIVGRTTLPSLVFPALLGVGIFEP